MKAAEKPFCRPGINLPHVSSKINDDRNFGLQFILRIPKRADILSSAGGPRRHRQERQLSLHSGSTQNRMLHGDFNFHPSASLPEANEHARRR